MLTLYLRYYKHKTLNWMPRFCLKEHICLVRSVARTESWGCSYISLLHVSILFIYSQFLSVFIVLCYLLSDGANGKHPIWLHAQTESQHLLLGSLYTRGGGFWILRSLSSSSSCLFSSLSEETNYWEKHKVHH